MTIQPIHRVILVPYVVQDIINLVVGGHLKERVLSAKGVLVGLHGLGVAEHLQERVFSAVHQFRRRNIMILQTEGVVFQIAKMVQRHPSLRKDV